MASELGPRGAGYYLFWLKKPELSSSSSSSDGIIDRPKALALAEIGPASKLLAVVGPVGKTVTPAERSGSVKKPT